MKKTNVIFLSILLLLSVSMFSCNRAWFNKADDTLVPNPPYTEGIDTEYEKPPTFEKGTLYWCPSIVTDSSSQKLYNAPQTTYTLPKYEIFEKGNMPDKVLTLNGNSVTLKYDETYRPANMSYYIDRYENIPMGVSIGYLENTDTVYTFSPGGFKVFSSIEQPVTESDYIAVCRDFMKNTLGLSDYGYMNNATQSHKRVQEENVSRPYEYDGFVELDDEGENAEIYYDFAFCESISQMRTVNSVRISINKDGSLRSYQRVGTDDYTEYRTNRKYVNSVLDFDRTPLDAAVDAGLNTMFSISGYALTDYLKSYTFMIVEGQLCVYVGVVPTVTDESTGENVHMHEMLSFLYPVT